MTKIEQLSVNFNKLRVEWQDYKFTSAELQKLLSSSGIPYPYIKLLCDVGAINNPTSREYYFPKDPVHITRIERFYNAALERSRAYQRNKKAAKAVEDVDVEGSVTSIIEEAIKVLQNTGEYRVYKKKEMIVWEEVK